MGSTPGLGGVCARLLQELQFQTSDVRLIDMIDSSKLLLGVNGCCPEMVPCGLPLQGLHLSPVASGDRCQDQAGDARTSLAAAASVD